MFALRSEAVALIPLAMCSRASPSGEGLVTCCGRARNLLWEPAVLIPSPTSSRGRYLGEGLVTCCGRTLLLGGRSRMREVFTLHPTPCTLHPSRFTLHPTPYTLHPSSYTLHPQPGSDSASDEGSEDDAMPLSPKVPPTQNPGLSRYQGWYLNITPYNTIHPKPETLQPNPPALTLNPSS